MNFRVDRCKYGSPGPRKMSKTEPNVQNYEQRNYEKDVIGFSVMSDKM